MQTYSIEAAQADFVALLNRVEHGEAVLITDHDKPIAKLGPPPLSAQTYKERIRSLRGAARGIDTTVERDEDRV
jgi:prevent-host-death family protein